MKGREKLTGPQTIRTARTGSAKAMLYVTSEGATRREATASGSARRHDYWVKSRPIGRRSGRARRIELIGLVGPSEGTSPCSG